MVDDRRMQQLLVARTVPSRMVDALIAEANGRGGLDNMSPLVTRGKPLAGLESKNGEIKPTKY